MSVFSMQTRHKLVEIGLTLTVAFCAWIFQLTVINLFAFHGALCNLPLTITIIWGYVFGSSSLPITQGELRHKSTAYIFLRQLMQGSVSGALMGALVGSLYASMLPIYPVCYPLIGFICGYFCARNISSESLLCIPVVLLGTVAAEFIMAWQLSLAGRVDVFAHLAQIALPESLLNALIAPFIYFPIRSWQDFYLTKDSPA